MSSLPQEVEYSVETDDSEVSNADENRYHRLRRETLSDKCHPARDCLLDSETLQGLQSVSFHNG